jgi:hypothetical protein
VSNLLLEVVATIAKFNSRIMRQEQGRAQLALFYPCQKIPRFLASLRFGKVGLRRS